MTHSSRHFESLLSVCEFILTQGEWPITRINYRKFRQHRLVCSEATANHWILAHRCNLLLLNRQIGFIDENSRSHFNLMLQQGDLIFARNDPYIDLFRASQSVVNCLEIICDVTLVWTGIWRESVRNCYFGVLRSIIHTQPTWNHTRTKWYPQHSVKCRLAVRHREKNCSFGVLIR